MTLIPRKYQLRAVDNFVNWIESDDPLATITIPVGTGKTITAAICLSRFDRKVLWVAHRQELIDQAVNAIRSVTDRSVSVEMAERKADADASIVVGSVQTLARTRKHLQSFTPDLIIIDEYHHYSENNVQYDGLLKRWPTAKVLGLTATPYRSNGEILPLGRVLIQMDIGTAVEKGYLVPPVPQSLITQTSLANVKTRMGDFAIDDLSKAINTDDRNRIITNRIVEIVRDEHRQGIVFAADVAHSKAMFAIMKNELRAAEIYGDTDKEDRRIIMEKIRNREIDVVFNNMVLTEGTDLPTLSFVCMGRPTKFLGLYNQCCGRGLRLCPEIDKKDCLVIDVFDKIKLKQTRVTFADMATAGDLYGERKRAANVLRADLPIDPISKEVKNFPILLKKENNTRWTVDDDSFTVSSWMIGENQWIMTWTAEIKQQKIVSRSIMTNWINQTNVVGLRVRHEKFGEGKILRVKDNSAVVGFAWDEKTIEKSHLKIEQIVNEYSSSESEVVKKEKLWYCCVPSDDLGRLIQFTKKGSRLFLESDDRLDRYQIDDRIQTEAKKDGVLHLIRSNARWKLAPASDKQKQYVSGIMNRIGFDIDLDTLSKGDASAVIEQIKWQNVIQHNFGTDYKEKLIGHNVADHEV